MYLIFFRIELFAGNQLNSTKISINGNFLSISSYNKDINDHREVEGLTHSTEK